jgi:hypothetical protein
MKGITVNQPWAWAIFGLEFPDGPKDVENRSQLWHHRGDLAILSSRRRPDALRSWSVHKLAGVELPPAAALPLGFVLGVVDLVDVHWAADGCCSSRWAEPRPYVSRLNDQRVARVSHLVLERPRELPQPIPSVGFLGVRSLPDDLGSLVAGMVAA